MERSDIKLIARDPAQFDPQAVDQLRSSARLAGIRHVVGLPDLHAGHGIAVGAAFWSPDHIHPPLVGSDIGCGMALWQMDGALRKFRLAHAERRLRDLDGPWDGDQAAALVRADLPASMADPSLGTIGGGNHFVELQRVEDIADPARFAELDLDADRLWMMVHSGSRGLGHAALQGHISRNGNVGLPADSTSGQAYLQDHDRAMAWAVLNRQIIADRFAEKLAMGGRRILDICHNSVTPHAVAGQAGWLHRKGAAPADRGLVAIPGSRGDFSFLVEPVAAAGDRALHSLAHGAGRRWSRSDAHARLSRRFRAAELERTPLGSRVICEDRRLIFEEAPQAYKDITGVIADLQHVGLIRVIARLRPLLSYKVRSQ
ncbi:RNA ligase RtcB family protein [Altererythrobacter xixiisoli]|uniref:3'-phosphate/5'-hydroxy nucleic acid ligase n=1 Tax=Croceibacterium xixiisoli TaxID=1476466 RepID=A0A6I4TUC3_9SPHN|nr:RNA ligase RtcB family protein [Croceibacterium xixiisoli]MXO99442.1 RNA ligase RtcB family protein [Croceibacterium xixiisoli]